MLLWRSFGDLQHKYVVTLGLLDILSEVENAEAREREHLVTQEPSQLERYNSSKKPLDEEFNRLRALANNCPNEQREITKVQNLVRQKLDELESAIRARSMAGWEVAQASAGSGKHLMDSIRQDVNAMERDEQSTLAGSSYTWGSLLRVGSLSLIGGALLVGYCLSIVRIVLARSKALTQERKKNYEQAKSDSRPCASKRR